jgi:hypothetical protein
MERPLQTQAKLSQLPDTYAYLPDHRLRPPARQRTPQPFDGTELIVFKPKRLFTHLFTQEEGFFPVVFRALCTTGCPKIKRLVHYPLRLAVEGVMISIL